MNDIFISYARKDKSKVELLAQILESRGWSVWWDPKIRSGQAFDRVIESALNDSKCVIVVWSQNSVDSDWVRAEAMNGLSRDILLPVSIEKGTTVPLRFSQIQSIELYNWSGELSAGIQQLTLDIESILLPHQESRYKGQEELTKIASENKDTASVPIEKVNYDHIVWKNAVFGLGDRVQTISKSGTTKPVDSGHSVELISDEGKIGTIIDFTEKGIPSYIPLKMRRMTRSIIDTRAIEVAIVRWDKQEWQETTSGQKVTIGEFDSRIHVSYLKVIKDGS